MSDADAVAMTPLAELQRFRRRALRVMFLRHSITACAGAAIVAAAAVLLTPLSDRGELALIAASMMAGLIGAGATTFLTRPGLRETAVLIDARCQTDDAVAAAVQFAGDTDPVSQLVVEQGQARLGHLRPAEVFPCEWTPRSTGLSAAATVAVLVLASSRTIGVPHWSGIPIIGGGSAAAVSESANGATGPAAGTPARTDADSVPAAVTAAGPFQPKSGTPQAESSASTAPGTSTSADRDARSPSSPGEVPPPVSDRPNVDTAGGPAAAGASTTARAGDRLGAGAMSSDTSGGSGPGNGRAAQESRAQAGGVSAGQLAKRAGSRPAPPEVSPNYEARYREAVGRAEEALAREQVPAELRDTVRAYFSAIRP